MRSTVTHLCKYNRLFSLVCKVEPRGLIARRVTEVAQSTLDMVTTAVDYPLCESLQPLPRRPPGVKWVQCFCTNRPL